ncbi:MAG: 50S ribosomal protein L13 [Candidatus Altiarchaeota archaeon]
MTIIDAENSILGRLASKVAKRALLGENIIIINAEKALLSGKQKNILADELKELKIRNIGNPLKGPFYQRRPDRYVRRVIKRMLPMEKKKGRDAFKRIMVYYGIPKEEIKKRHNIEVDEVKIEKIEDSIKNISNSLTVGEICKFISGKNKNA